MTEVILGVVAGVQFAIFIVLAAFGILIQKVQRRDMRPLIVFGIAFAFSGAVDLFTITQHLLGRSFLHEALLEVLSETGLIAGGIAILIWLKHVKVNPKSYR